MVSQAAHPTTRRTPERDIFRVAGVALTVASIEWYDFFIYGTAAALIFPKLFFPEQTPLVGALLSFAAFGVGFIARPVGGLIFGHLGDAAGRKKALVIALLSMGVATTTIGLLPTFSTIGVLAPILLVSLRFIQGVAVGGQQGGALLLVAESAPTNRRGFFSSFAQAGAPAGIILANLAFLLVTSVTSSASFESWGWRIPFLASIVLVALAAYIQVRLEETPAFRRLKENTVVQHQAVDHARECPKTRGPHTRSPVVEALRKYPKQIALAAGAYTAVNMTYYVFTTFVISFGTSPAFLGMSKNIFLAAVLIASLVQLVALPLAGALTDRVGRRTVYLTGALLLGIFSFFFWPLLDTRSPALIIVALVVGLGVLHSMMYGPQGAFFAETFSTSVRYSGVSMGVQLGSLLGGAFAPLVATALLAEIGSTIAIATYMAAMCAVTFISVLFLRETRRSELDRNPTAVEAPGTSK